MPLFIICEHGTKTNIGGATGISFKAIGRQTVYHYTEVSRLVRKHKIFFYQCFYEDSKC